MEGIPVVSITFKNVNKRYAGGTVAVDNLNLSIQDKEFIVLLGPSGCGKSTTLNMIAGLEEVSEGELRFGQELVNYTPPHRRDVAMVFQSYALYPHKSVFENIAFSLRMRNYKSDEINRRVREAAARLDIAHLLDRRPSQLSGGQRQRVALGRALVRMPAVFLMDEPLSNLDAALRISMRAEIKELHRTMRTTFVYVTHDQAEALTLADRIVVMRDGVIQQVGTPDDIYEKPANTFVASFLGSPPMNYLDGVIASDAGATQFHRGDLRLPLPQPVAERLASSVGRPVRIGIRPEDIDERSDPHSKASVRGPVISVLPVGSDQFLCMRVEGVEMFFRVGKDVRHLEGETAALAPAVNRLHVFDAETGANLVW
jgi:multiple sugar transport system ATP-binding protein